MAEAATARLTSAGGGSAASVDVSVDVSTGELAPSFRARVCAPRLGGCARDVDALNITSGHRIECLVEGGEQTNQVRDADKPERSAGGRSVGDHREAACRGDVRVCAHQHTHSRGGEKV